MNQWLMLMSSILVFELFIYVWHRFMHKSNRLWLSFHQLHHSAERVDTFGAYFFSPLDMAGFTFIGSLSLSVFVGLDPQVITLFLFITTFLAIFQHTNINTPVWLGYIIQRPESHSVHHQKGVHAHNYSDLPIFDILFGTFKNPKDFQSENGFYPGASTRIGDMLTGKDISRPSQKT
ncbi:sterol desaturase family protein [Marinicella rhabdoformis]|uniref:sterol desaturase family protein n=1 Tax=Marinicella rhabdoformis TaxID=2580566 RepID=UPI001C550961|nr:sterol desaturase family protein [Marinicella rhabdoformis]